MARLGLGRRRPPAGDYLDEDAAADADPVVPNGPMRMRGREPMYGFATAAVLAAGGIANLLDTTGAGAPPHPVLWPTYAGFVLAAGLVASIRLRNRLLSPFVAIFAAFFLTLERGPNSLSYPHIVVLVVAVGFAVALTMRQRREQRALTPARQPGSRRRGSQPAEDERSRKPVANRRYTPPKSARTSTGSGKSRTARR